MHFIVEDKVQNKYYSIMSNTDDLKTLRKIAGITQFEAAKLAGISLRSYKSYENETRKKEAPLYKYLVEMLQRETLFDEEHGILSLQAIIERCSSVFELYDVEFCYIFGSYSRTEANERSDVDLLVSTTVTGMDFYGMAERLRQALQKKVDLLGLEQLNNNPELLHDILKDGIKIYEKNKR